jgi:exonuclease SbcC
VDELVAEPERQLDEKIERQQMLHRLVDASIQNEQERLSKADTLTGMIDDLGSKLEEIRHRIHVREIAEELIRSAARNFSQQFNHDLRELASRTLPLFTEGRYEHLNIDTELNVRAFSSEKRDYMNLDEISSGTQRQIMLAVRLALSQELVNTTSSGNQFIFLDEPFAFFDQTRTRNAMSILPDLSDEITQVWVIAQEFPEDTASQMEIACSREYEKLPADA